jgi:aromatic ring-opening dioxygenase catalytic subunit (LigB family)
MARLVFGAGTPHGPMMPKQVLDEGPDSELGKLFARVREQLELISPDLIVMFDCDHFVNFFLNNMPALCVGIVDQASGPAEDRVEMPQYTVKMHQAFARQLFAYALQREFDASSTEEMVLDHSILVPLHFLTPRMEIPIVPVYIRGLAPPLPVARRCLALGRMVADFIRQWPSQERVAVLASGSISLEVGGPRIGRTDHGWMHTVVDAMQSGDIDGLIEQASTERMLKAGNVSGELLNWIALLGAVSPTTPTYVDQNEGHAFAVWHLEER